MCSIGGNGNMQLKYHLNHFFTYSVKVKAWQGEDKYIVKRMTLREMNTYTKTKIAEVSKTYNI